MAAASYAGARRRMGARRGRVAGAGYPRRQRADVGTLESARSRRCSCGRRSPHGPARSGSTTLARSPRRVSSSACSTPWESTQKRRHLGERRSRSDATLSAKTTATLVVSGNLDFALGARKVRRDRGDRAQGPRPELRPEDPSARRRARGDADHGEQSGGLALAAQSRGGGEWDLPEHAGSVSACAPEVRLTRLPRAC